MKKLVVIVETGASDSISIGSTEKYMRYHENEWITLECHDFIELSWEVFNDNNDLIRQLCNAYIKLLRIDFSQLYTTIYVDKRRFSLLCFEHGMDPILVTRYKNIIDIPKDVFRSIEQGDVSKLCLYEIMFS